MLNAKTASEKCLAQPFSKNLQPRRDPTAHRHAFPLCHGHYQHHQNVILDLIDKPIALLKQMGIKTVQGEGRKII